MRRHNATETEHTMAITIIRRTTRNPRATANVSIAPGHMVRAHGNDDALTVHTVAGDIIVATTAAGAVRAMRETDVTAWRATVADRFASIATADDIAAAAAGDDVAA